MNQLLLDTNVVVWLLLGDRDAVSPAARDALDDEGNTLSVSAASVWEIAIKRSLGKLEIEDRWPSALAALDVDHVPVTALHAQHVEGLPWHHRDPFDRLLVAQAIVESHTLVTADRQLAAYDVPVIW
ncbi:MAG: type II toxin-antitoxin system VapC family toxin [Solirubrobacteraceae bacterium]|nr:type II toxin-antitoxin system VapC family toxin [Solirubrobacteraceae bacterium]